MRYPLWGSWWAIQRNAGFSLGLHLDWQSRVCGSGVPFGPYLDLHIGPFVLSVGRNPIYAGEIDLLQSFSRGGLNAREH